MWKIEKCIFKKKKKKETLLKVLRKSEENIVKPIAIP